MRERLKTVDVSGQRIYDELVEQGFGGQRSTVYELLEWLRQGHLPPSMADHLPKTTEAQQRAICTAKQGSWWFVRPPDALSPAARERLGLLQSVVEGSSTVYELMQDFATLLRTRLDDASTRLTDWIDRARTSHIVELERFANGIQKDAAAVLGAITSPWSNGQTEGQVTRVKLIKRQMYGRAKFDLLRARILLA